jgi:hypothetical protein
VHSPVADTSTLVGSATQQQQQKQKPTKKHKHPTEKKKTISHWNLPQGWTVFLQQQK